MRACNSLKPVYICVLLALYAQSALANPLNPTVLNGQASFATTGNALTVTNTPGTIINWQGFSIGANEITRFVQQSAVSAVLNRVISNNPSSILGSLQSNGRVFLINPSGIVFGAGATVDVAGLVASTLSLGNADFLAGRDHFTQVPGAANISNAGNITAQTGGQIFLIAPNVGNTGVITAANGEILLAAGHSVDLVSTTNPNLRVSITAPAGDATNVGRLIASSGSLGLFGTIVRNSGQVSADSATMQGGKIVFKASQRTEVSGTVTANGTAGGTIQAIGNQVGVMGGATVTANGTQNGGSIFIGGDYQGKNLAVPNAQVSYVASAANIHADATENGNGGKVIVWADDTTRAYGSLSARGGALSGNGGFIETSGKQYLDVAGIRVSTTAMSGTVGNWLLDPTDITIIYGSAGTPNYLPTTNSTITDGTINASLASTDVTIATSGGSTGGGDITFDASGGVVAINGAGTSLNLQADRDIKFTGGSTTFSGSLGVVLSPAGKITTESGSSVTLNGSTIAWLSPAKTWENSGTLNFSGSAQVHLNFNSSPNQASTFHNMTGGVVNVSGTPPGRAFFSNPSTLGGIITNDGTFNITAGTSFEAVYSQSSAGTLNIANGQFLSMQNADMLSGTFNIGTGSSLTLSELHNGARTFSGATINDAGTLSFGPGSATFSNTTLSYTGGTGNYSIPAGITYSGNAGYSATGNLILASPINTTGNVTLNSDSDGVGGGNIQITSSIVSNGGNITFAGGINGAGAAAGASTASSAVASGVYLSGATVNAGGGNITMRGNGMAGTSFGADGIYITSNSVVQTTGAGTVTLNGTGGAGGAGSSFNSGIRLGMGAQLSSLNGAITLNGQGGAGNSGDNYGVYVHDGATIVSAGSGSVTLDGTGASTGTANAGIRISASGGATQVTSASGAIYMTGIGGTDGDGLQVVSGAKVQSGTGAITLHGTGGNGGSANDGVYVTGASTLVSSGGNIEITGDNLNTVGTGNRGVAITSSARIVATGTLTLTGTKGAGTTSDAVRLSGTPAGGVVNAAAGLSITGTGDVVVDTGSVVNAGGNATFSATNNILFSANSSLAPSAGAVNVDLISDSNGTGGGGIYLDTGSSLSSNGGNITMGGMPSVGYAIGNGTVTGGITFNSGIYVLGNITAGEGNVTMRGEGRASGSGSNHLADGITFAGGLLSSNGAVSIDGLAHVRSETTAGTEVTAGVDFLGVGTRLSTQTGTVTVTGLNDAGAGFCRAQGITVEAGTIIETTGVGTLTLNGTSTGYDTGWGVGIFGGTVRTTAVGGGAITLNGINVTNPDGGVVILDGSVLSSGGEIRIIGAGLGGSGTIGTSTIGGASSGDILIKANNSGPINITSASSINAGSNTLTLILAGGPFNGNDSSITAGALRLLGSGTFNLGSINIGMLVADVTSNVAYSDTDGFAIGSVTSFDGTAVTTTTGVTTGNSNFTGTTVAGNITLNAGSAISTGTGALNLTATGGNLNIAGNVSAGIFTLGGGTWNQVSGTLPGFTVNDFSIAGGTFIRTLGGNGSIATPYQLTDIYGVQGMGSAGMLSNAYVLANNIDASGTTNWNAGHGFLPIGKSVNSFTGTFDGQNHIISNLTINRSANYVGLFGYTSGANISNVGLAGGSVGGGGYVGGLVGYNNGGTISGSYNTGSVSTVPCECHSSDVGGLVGYNSGTVSNSYATGNVTGFGDNVGGLAGNNYSGTISNSYASGVSVSGYRSVGGLVGDNNGTISNTYSSGGTVSGVVDFGGLVGANWHIINASYSTNAVAVGGGGLVGWNEMSVNNSFWNTQTSGQEISSGGLGLTTAQMQQQANFTSSTAANGNVNPNWDFAESWVMYDGFTHPLLRSFMTQLTVTANNAAKTYDGLAYSGGNGVVYNGFVNGETNAVLGGSLAYGGSSQGAINTGNYPITPSGFTSGNYTISYVNGALTVNPAALSVAANAASKTYDGLAYSGGNGVVYSGLVNGETNAALGGALVYGGTSQGAISAGNYPIAPSGLTSINYTISYVNGALTVNPAALSVAANAAGKTYDGLAYSGGNGVVYSGLVNGETNAALGGALVYGGTSQGAISAGSYPIAPSGLASGNYTISYVNGALTVNPAALSVAANATSKTYDGLAYSGGNGVVYNGFVNGETNAVLGGTLAYGGSSQGAISAGNYPIAPSGLTSGNYTISYVNGALTVNPAALSVTANAASKTYDGLAYSGGNGVVYRGLVNGETNAVLGGSLVYGGTSQGAINAGSYPIAPSGLASGNYTISYVDGALTVNPAPASAPVAPQPVVSSLVSMSIPAIDIPFNPPVQPALTQAQTIDEINLLNPAAAGSDEANLQAAQDVLLVAVAPAAEAAAPLPICR